MYKPSWIYSGGFILFGENMSNQEVIEKLRGFVSTLRRTPQPVSEVIPYLVLAADRLEECLKHNNDRSNNEN